MLPVICSRNPFPFPPPSPSPSFNQSSNFLAICFIVQPCVSLHRPPSYHSSWPQPPGLLLAPPLLMFHLATLLITLFTATHSTNFQPIKGHHYCHYDDDYGTHNSSALVTTCPSGFGWPSPSSHLCGLSSGITYKGRLGYIWPRLTSHHHMHCPPYTKHSIACVAVMLLTLLIAMRQRSTIAPWIAFTKWNMQTLAWPACARNGLRTCKVILSPASTLLRLLGLLILRSMVKPRAWGACMLNALKPSLATLLQLPKLSLAAMTTSFYHYYNPQIANLLFILWLPTAVLLSNFGTNSQTPAGPHSPLSNSSFFSDFHPGNSTLIEHNPSSIFSTELGTNFIGTISNITWIKFPLTLFLSSLSSSPLNLLVPPTISGFSLISCSMQQSSGGWPAEVGFSSLFRQSEDNGSTIFSQLTINNSSCSPFMGTACALPSSSCYFSLPLPSFSNASGHLAKQADITDIFSGPWTLVTCTVLAWTAALLLWSLHRRSWQMSMHMRTSKATWKGAAKQGLLAHTNIFLAPSILIPNSRNWVLHALLAFCSCVLPAPVLASTLSWHSYSEVVSSSLSLCSLIPLVLTLGVYSLQARRASDGRTAFNIRQATTKLIKLPPYRPINRKLITDNSNYIQIPTHIMTFLGLVTYLPLSPTILLLAITTTFLPPLLLRSCFFLSVHKTDALLMVSHVPLSFSVPHFAPAPPHCGTWPAKWRKKQNNGNNVGLPVSMPLRQYAKDNSRRELPNRKRKHPTIGIDGKIAYTKPSLVLLLIGMCCAISCSSGILLTTAWCSLPPLTTIGLSHSEILASFEEEFRIFEVLPILLVSGAICKSSLRAVIHPSLLTSAATQVLLLAHIVLKPPCEVLRLLLKYHFPLLFEIHMACFWQILTVHNFIKYLLSSGHNKLPLRMVYMLGNHLIAAWKFPMLIANAIIDHALRAAPEMFLCLLRRIHPSPVSQHSHFDDDNIICDTSGIYNQNRPISVHPDYFPPLNIPTHGLTNLPYTYIPTGVQVLVKLLDGHSITIQICPSSTFLDLRRAISAKSGMPRHHIHLLSNSRRFRDDATLAMAGIQAGSCVALTSSLSGGMQGHPSDYTMPVDDVGHQLARNPFEDCITGIVFGASDSTHLTIDGLRHNPNGLVCYHFSKPPDQHVFRELQRLNQWTTPFIQVSSTLVPLSMEVDFLKSGECRGTQLLDPLHVLSHVDLINTATTFLDDSTNVWDIPVGHLGSDAICRPDATHVDSPPPRQPSPVRGTAYPMPSRIPTPRSHTPSRGWKPSLDRGGPPALSSSSSSHQSLPATQPRHNPKSPPESLTMLPPESHAIFTRPASPHAIFAGTGALPVSTGDLDGDDFPATQVTGSATAEVDDEMAPTQLYGDEAGIPADDTPAMVAQPSLPGPPGSPASHGPQTPPVAHTRHPSPQLSMTENMFQQALDDRADGRALRSRPSTDSDDTSNILGTTPTTTPLVSPALLATAATADPDLIPIYLPVPAAEQTEVTDSNPSPEVTVPSIANVGSPITPRNTQEETHASPPSNITPAGVSHVIGLEQSSQDSADVIQSSAPPVSAKHEDMSDDDPGLPQPGSPAIEPSPKPGEDWIADPPFFTWKFVGVDEVDPMIDMVFNWDKDCNPRHYLIPISFVGRAQVDEIFVLGHLLNYIFNKHDYHLDMSLGPAAMKRCVIQLTPSQYKVWTSEVTVLAAGSRVPRHRIEVHEDIPGHTSTFLEIKADTATILLLLLSCYTPCQNDPDNNPQASQSYFAFPIFHGNINPSQNTTLSINTTNKGVTFEDWKFVDMAKRLRCQVWIGQSDAQPFPDGLPDPSLLFVRGSEENPTSFLPFMGTSSLLIHGSANIAAILVAFTSLFFNTTFPLDDAAQYKERYRAEEHFIQDYPGQYPCPKDPTVGVPRSGYAVVNCPIIHPDPGKGKPILPPPLHPLIGPCHRNAIPAHTPWRLKFAGSKAPRHLISAVYYGVKKMVNVIRHNPQRFRSMPYSNGFVSLNLAKSVLHQKDLECEGELMPPWDLVQIAWDYYYPSLTEGKCRFQFAVARGCSDQEPCDRDLFVRVTSGLNVKWAQIAHTHLLQHRVRHIISVKLRGDRDYYPCLFAVSCIRADKAEEIWASNLQRAPRYAWPFWYHWTVDGVLRGRCCP